MNDNQSLDVDAARSMLKEIADMCENASLTGSLSGGSGRVVLKYNAIVNQFTQSGTLPASMFTTLPESANFGEIAVEARMLSGYLRKDQRRNGNGESSILMRLAPFVSPEDLASLVREHLQGGGQFDLHNLTHLAPFLNKEDISRLVGAHMRTPSTPPAPAEPAPPAAPEPVAVAPVATPEPPAAPAPSRDERVSVLLERLKNPRLSDDERAELVDRIRSLTSG
jgi:hypothetical protein